VALVENVVFRARTGNEFTNDHVANGNGWAHLTSPTATAGVHQAQWDQSTAGRYCAGAAAFKAAR